ncbi:hypothetical protein PVK06_001658 [Gossypium arboreum]|uniref:Reverse transcriptase domain-containing protein n=1 Tax=Gossypium arboreum TaxID=29729 RepID=A0ABR0R1J6_GOSAR|nr:hypothetical protein PVK06_001658 [Gossypium arboreum]
MNTFSRFPTTEFPAFPTSLLPILKAIEEPTKTPTARAESTNLETIVDEGETVAVGLKKMTLLNLENVEEEKDETAIAIIATTKGKDPVPPTPPASTTAQDCDSYHLIDELTYTDKEGNEMSLNRKLWYKEINSLINLEKCDRDKVNSA